MNRLQYPLFQVMEIKVILTRQLAILKYYPQKEGTDENHFFFLWSGEGEW